MCSLGKRELKQTRKKLVEMRRVGAALILYAVYLSTWTPAIAGDDEKKPQQTFSLLSSQQTNVTFNNELVDEIDHNILIYSNYYGGAGVGIGDFNNDGLPDLYFAGNLVKDELYINQGGFVFEDVSTSAGLVYDGGWSSGVTVADINGDGLDDIYVSRELYDDQPELRRNLCYINNGDLTFTESAEALGISDQARSRHATFLDYDKDGDLDLFVLNHPPNTGNYSPLKGIDFSDVQFSSKLYRNDGSSFSDVTVAAGLLKSGFPNSVSASDLDNDGWTDLYVSNDFDAPDNYYHNNGDGTFSDLILESTKHISFYSMGVDAGDINNDGWLDVMVLDMVAEDNFRLKANMSGMNPDAFWDVVKKDGHHQYMFNTLQLNQGNNVFSDVAQLAGMPSTDWSWSNLLADFDNDGDKDVHITNGLLRDIRNTDSEKEFAKYVGKIITDYIMKHPDDPEVTIWDIMDLEEALKIIPSKPLSNYAFENNGDLTFTKVMPEWGMDQVTFSHGSAIADLNGDGYLDLVVNNMNREAFIYKNNGPMHNQSNYLRVDLQDPSNQTILGSRVIIRCGERKQTYEFTNVRGMYSTSEQVAHFGLGDADIVEEVQVVWPDQTTSTLTDIKTNQMLSISKERGTAQLTATTSPPLVLDITATSGLEYCHQENIFDDYRYQVLLPHKQSQYGPALAVGDVTGDGLDDLFFGGASGQSGELYFQQANGTFKRGSEGFAVKQSFMEDVDASFFDADNDGDLDLYVVSGGNEFPAGSPFYQDRLYLNDGKGALIMADGVLPQDLISGGKVLPHDIDQDGDMDLFVGGRLSPRDYPTPTSSKIYLNEDGYFRDATSEWAPQLENIGMVTDATFADVDLDGVDDLIITGEWMPLTIYKNDGQRLVDMTKEMGLDQTNGWWFSVTSGDFDGDGDQDFIFGNLGLNYKYKASPNEPFEVYYEDFDGNTSKDIVLSYYNFGEKFPVRGRSCSVQQVPALGQKFETYEGFASSNLADIYGMSALRPSLHYEAFMFESVYAENRDGQLSLQPLPNEAQLTSINDAVVEDVDGDGHLDAILGGNLYMAEIETARNDAGVGLILLGDGAGNWKAVPPYESGLYVNKDTRKIRSVQSTAGRMILFANNDDHPNLIKITR